MSTATYSADPPRLHTGRGESRKRTAIYCRVSTPGQKNTISLPEQERINRAHAATLGWEVSEPHVYCEVEGGEDLYRPCMDRLWDAIQAHEIDGVVIDVLDRLSRDEGDQGAFYHHADRYGVTVELASQDYDETEQGRTMRFIAGLHARMEHADIRRRTQRGRKARVAAGKLMTGAWPLYGYVWDDPERGGRSYYVIDPETGHIVVRIFTAVADGVPIRRLARELEQEGVPTPFQVLESRGMLPAKRIARPVWNHATILRMLWHPAYWGAHSAYRLQRTTTKVRPAETGITRKVRHISERALDDPARVALPNSCPALVSPELAARVHAHLRENQAENAGRNPDPLATIWRGLAVCGHCGGKMYTGAIASGGGRCYSCRSYGLVNGGAPTSCPGGAPTITAGVLDPAGWADVVSWLQEERNVERLLAEWQHEEQNTEHSMTSRLDAVAGTIAALRNKMDALAETIAETSKGESRRTLQEKLDRYADQVTAEEKKRERLLQEAHDAVDHAREARNVRAWVRVVAAKASTMTREQQRATLKALGAVATVWRADYIHPDGWPQRYRIQLHFTGFTGRPVTLPATQSAYPDTDHRSSTRATPLPELKITSM
jgi:DNA invertase Pin-like site-specific DNA recombinase